MLFKQKDKNIIRVIHYEGLNDFNQDYPCTIEEKDDVFEIRKIKPEMTVTLPKQKIVKIDSLRENEFMQKYHNTVGINNKKYYLVITYQKGEQTDYIAFWGTAKEAIRFDDLKYKYCSNENYSL